MADERNWKHFAKMAKENLNTEELKNNNMNEEQRIRMKQKFADAGEQSALRKADVMRWVAVAESLPTEHKLYLTYDGTFQVFRYWKGNHFEGEQVATEPKVTYWMEVPEPPFAEAQNQALPQSAVSGSLGFDEGYAKGYSDATKEACQEIREHYHPNDR
jgi:hypothetical protein